MRRKREQESNWEMILKIMMKKVIEKSFKASKLQSKKLEKQQKLYLLRILKKQSV